MGGWGDAERGKRGDVGRQGARGPGLRLRDAASARLAGSGIFFPSICLRVSPFSIYDAHDYIGRRSLELGGAEYFRWYFTAFPVLFQLMLLSGHDETR